MNPPNDQSPAPSLIPYADPVDRFAHLPPHVREWLQGLSREDCELFESILISYRRAGIAGWMVKWLFFTALGVASSVALFAEHIGKILAAIRGS